MQTFIKFFALSVGYCLTVSVTQADLVYYFNPYQLEAIDGSGETASITGGELVMVDDAADDGMLDPLEVISASLNTSLFSPLTGIPGDASANFSGTFAGGQLIGGFGALFEWDLSNAFVTWGVGDQISFSFGSQSYITSIEANNFVIASSVVPEPNALAVISGILLITLIGRKKRLACV